MKKLLLFLAEHCEFLFRPDYYRIVDSGSSHSMGNAHVDLRWREIVLQFTLDRSAIDLGRGSGPSTSASCVPTSARVTSAINR